MVDSSFASVQEQLRRFAAERDWDQFHTPKNLAMALIVEAAELVELFQWRTPEESAAIRDQPDELARVGEELADVYLYLVRLADVLGIDLDEAVQHKIARTARKSPVGTSRGSAKKATETRP